MHWIRYFLKFLSPPTLNIHVLFFRPLHYRPSQLAFLRRFPPTSTRSRTEPRCANARRKRREEEEFVFIIDSSEKPKGEGERSRRPLASNPNPAASPPPISIGRRPSFGRFGRAAGPRISLLRRIAGRAPRSSRDRMARPSADGSGNRRRVELMISTLLLVRKKKLIMLASCVMK